MQDVDLTPDGMIHDRGRGPEIKGTRITVYVIMDHYGNPDWPPERIAELYRLTVAQVQAALDYIEAHQAELSPDYEKMLARERAGNTPEVRAILAESHKRVLARLNEEQRRRVEELDRLFRVNGNGAAGGS